MQNNNTPDQEQIICKHCNDTGLLTIKGGLQYYCWHCDYGAKLLYEKHPERFATNNYHLSDTNVGDIVQPADDQEQSLQTPECYWDEHLKPNLPNHSKDFEPPAWALDFAEQFGRHVLKSSEKEISDLKEIALKLGERVREAETWISVEERLPDELQRVSFVVKSRDEAYNGKVLGGKYTGDPKSEYPSRKNEFSTPGIGWEASHWMPAPAPPNKQQ
jgi:hypothetical protein